MSLRVETQALLDRAMRHNEAMSNNSVSLSSDFVFDLFMLENEILAFKAGVMDDAPMRTLRDNLRQIVNNYRIP